MSDAGHMLSSKPQLCEPRTAGRPGTKAPPDHSVPAPCLAPLASSVGGGGEVGLASAAITQQAGKHSHLSGKAMRRGVHRIHIRNLGALQLLFDVQECWHIWQLLGSRRDAAEECALARPDGDEEVHWPDQTGMRRRLLCETAQACKCLL